MSYTKEMYVCWVFKMWFTKALIKVDKNAIVSICREFDFKFVYGLKATQVQTEKCRHGNFLWR